VAVDAAGNVYIADTNNQRIRKVSASSGDITTIAGTGTESLTGDGGLPTSATLVNPFGVAVDAAGNVYIANFSSIREVTVSTGLITTVAGTGTSGFSGDGGLAKNAQMSEPYGVAVDASGNLYISDYANNRIRKVTASTGIITTIAGTGTVGFSGDGGLPTNAELNYPEGVAVDAAGNVYISDTFNELVRKVTASTGIITTFAGNGTYNFRTGDGGVATSAEVYHPGGLALDVAGNLYIADSSDNRIRVVGVPATPSN
jgi:sugar lactone lactonase YvrE